MLNTNQFLPIALKYFNGISFQLEICPVTSLLTQVDVVKCWNLSGDGQTKSPVTFIDIRKQIIWGNKYITFENKPIFFLKIG
jgi:hypothetical protein